MSTSRKIQLINVSTQVNLAKNKNKLIKYRKNKNIVS